MSTLVETEPLFEGFQAPATMPTQWRAERFQLVNWGGFDGRKSIDFHPGTTLLAGSSGVGKSTILDAYIALMMNSRSAFNGASNDSGGGPARGDDQRSLLSYLRGQQDRVDEGDTGRLKPKNLRGNGAATWGAIAMTFRNDTGQAFTAMRVYYAPANITRDGELTMRMCTLEDEIDLADLDACVPSRFAHADLSATFETLKPYNTYISFAHALHTRLGIGANGDGAKALELLVRIQSGHQIRDVDDLYKQLVLDMPATYKAADAAIEHFNNLEDSYLKMLDEQKRATVLAPITDLHATLTRAQGEIDTIDTIGVADKGDTPLSLWALRTERTLLDTASDTNRAEYRQSADRARAAADALHSLERELTSVEGQHRDAGGADLERLNDSIATHKARQGETADNRAALAARITVLASPLDCAEDFDLLRGAAEQFLANAASASTDLDAKLTRIAHQEYPLQARRTEIREELESLNGRAGRVTADMDALRRQMAQAAGLDPAELPYLAELIDIPKEHDRWRTAVETVLSGPARRLLVPAEKFKAFSAAIDPLKLRGRVHFQSVPTNLPHTPRTFDPDTVAGKLIFKDSPYTAWVQRHLDSALGATRCVLTSAELDGPGRRVTITGQEREGDRGSHGRGSARNIIGFSNEDLLADYADEDASLDDQLKALGQQRNALGHERRTLSARKSAYEAVQATTWASIDVETITARIAELEAAKNRIIDTDDQLRALSDRITELRTLIETARPASYDLKRVVNDLDAVHERIVTRQDRISDDLERIERTGSTELTDAQAERLQHEFAAVCGPMGGDEQNFGENLRRLKERLDSATAHAREEVTRTTRELERTFSLYKDQWDDDPNIGRTLAAYPSYAALLDTILATGLHERRDEWRRRLARWSGEDLVPLNRAMISSIDEIEDRMAPVNDILHTLPFGANIGRLQIRLRRHSNEKVTKFRAELARLSSGATQDLPDEALERRFTELQTFINRLRRKDDERGNPHDSDRDALLDVRKHTEIKAVKQSREGVYECSYDTLGQKSGGETQELVAFIVGSALRYRLGDENNARPTFAPVFLDEGFVKSDSEFAGRAVQAWLGLGFQLIIGAPTDKTNGLEPYMGSMLAIRKNDAGYSFITSIVDAPTPAA